MRFAALLALLSPMAFAGEPLLDIQIGSIERDALRVSGLRVQADVGEQSTALRVRIAQLDHPGLETPLRHIEIGCPDGELRWPALRCAEASVVVAESPWGAQAIQTALDWQSFDEWTLSFKDLRYAQDRLSGHLQMQAGKWQAELRANAVHLAHADVIRQLLAPYELERFGGMLGGRLQAAGDLQQIDRLDLFVGIRELAYADAQGMQAAEGLSGRLSLAARRQGDQWTGALELNSLGGEWFSEPVFVDYTAQPLQVILDGQWWPEVGQLRVKKLLGNLGGGIQVEGTGVWSLDDWRPQQAALRVDSSDLGQLYATLLQPLAIGTRLDALEVSGGAGLRLQWQNHALTDLDVVIHALDFADQADALGGNGIQGSLHWRAVGSAPDSHLSWDALQLGKLLFGSADLHANASGAHAYLVSPLRLPFHGGIAELRELTLVALDDDWSAGLSARLRDVQLDTLSLALGWPEMAGTLNGELPRARYANDRLDVQGDILVQAFGGDLRLRHIVLSELRSVAPIMEGELELVGLDLAKLTRTFSLGDIQGSLQGEVRGLRLVAWQPDRFDAHVFTPEDDPLPHRISQRALQDLTELGSGLSGIVSGSFLRFFDTFAYDRVELKVRQRGNRASLDGAPHPEGGFYLVRGAGVPRIDVVGRNREIAWNDLIARLKAMRLEGLQLQ